MPIQIAGTSRQHVSMRNGIALERKYITLPAPVWLALQSLSIEQRRTDSRVVESLINLASKCGTNKDQYARTINISN
jgi:hypothetical protein